MKKVIYIIFLAGILVFLKIDKTNAQTCTTTAPTNTGKVTLSATITDAGNYKVWSRIKTPDASNNSFYLQIDGGCPILVGGSTTIPVNTWTWIDYQNGNSSNKITANLTNGDHVLTIIGNGTGVGVDKLLLTQNLSCTPTGNGDNCPALIPSYTPTPSPTIVPATATPILSPSPFISPANGTTTLNFSSIKLHGLGRGGDNTNPNSQGAQNLTRKTRQLTVELEDVNGNILPAITGNITYQDVTGDFKGNIVLPDSIQSGNYLLKIKSPQFLKKRTIGILSLNKGSTNQISPVALITGDINNDNQLTIADYNLLIDCYSDFLPAKNCDASKKIAADIWDDGNVNALDYNIFLKELSVIAGE